MPSAHVLSLAIRTGKLGPMRELAEVAAHRDGGLEGDNRSSRERGLTLLSAEQWAAATAELGAELPWHTRRANVLVEGIDLPATIGRTLRIGEVEVAVLAETEPCGVMERQRAGLRAALTPDCRGGVYGRILRGGTLRVGDAVGLVESASEAGASAS